MALSTNTPASSVCSLLTVVPMIVRVSVSLCCPDRLRRDDFTFTSVSCATTNAGLTADSSWLRRYRYPTTTATTTTATTAMATPAGMSIDDTAVMLDPLLSVVGVMSSASLINGVGSVLGSPTTPAKASAVDEAADELVVGTSGPITTPLLLLLLLLLLSITPLLLSITPPLLLSP
jgi:hypothetical protein